jgi:NTE family protein
VGGGGGPRGVGWEAGIAAGLEEQGVRLGEADLIAGTSAGSIVGAQLALGRSAADLLAAQRTLSERDEPGLRPVQGAFDLAPLIAHFTKWMTSDAPPEQLRAELGAFALQAKTMSEDEWLATFGTMRELGFDAWPERRYVCTAVDTADGSFVTWDSDSGVELARAVASSCAVPGIFPPVTIKGRRYMDGGMRSSTNADLAKGYDAVLVVAPTVGAGLSAGAMARWGNRAELVRKRLDGEIEGLRAGGSAVELIVPDEGSLEAFGPNLMDATRRRGAAEAGLRQGRVEAARVRAIWG